MKIAVINFSGNVGKSMIARNLLLPRLEQAHYYRVESINDSEGPGDKIRGSQFGQLQEELLLSTTPAVVDVGSSNVEDFIKLMTQFHGSQDDFDLFIVPVVKDTKQLSDTIATIETLGHLKVPAEKIHLIFNKVEIDEDIEANFYPLIAYHKDKSKFTLSYKSSIYYNEVYQKLNDYKISLEDLLSDPTDYKKQLMESQSPDAKADAVARISMGRLAISAHKNLDDVYETLILK